MEKLSTEAIEKRLESFPEWSVVGDALQRTFAFEDFIGSMAFVSRAADLAERLQHHPDIMIRYNKVTLTLTTHDVNGLSDADFTFARDIDATLVH